MHDFLQLTSSWVRPHLALIAFTFMATLLVLYGSDIIRVLRGIIKPYPLLVRVLILMILCAFGFGWAATKLTWLMERYLFAKTGAWTGVVVLLTFIALALLADRKKHV